MSEVMTVRELRDQLINMSVDDWDLPVYVYDTHTSETFPLEIVDPTINGRVDLNFSSEEEKEYRVHVAVYHSFKVHARTEDEAHRIASDDVIWDDHITDCNIVIEKENDDE
jgi:hypothetical protein